MSWWDERVVPRLVDRTLSERVTGEFRDQVCAGLRGDVLELGFGSGLNLAHYGADVTSVAAVEPADLAWQRAAPRIEAFARPVTRIGLDGAHLAAADASVDAVVTTFTLCTIPRVEAALAEARRVLRPGGALHFAEHSLAPDAGPRRMQQRLARPWARLAGGCQLNRDIEALVRAAGFDAAITGRYIAPLKTFSWLVSGTASPTW